MLVLETVMFVAGLYLILQRHLTTPIKAAIVTVAITWFPPVLVLMTVVWKDSLMAGFFLLGIGLLTGKRSRWFGVLAITAAVATRHNATAAALPIFLFLFPVSLPRCEARSARARAMDRVHGGRDARHARADEGARDAVVLFDRTGRHRRHAQRRQRALLR